MQRMPCLLYRSIQKYYFQYILICPGCLLTIT